MSGISNLKVCAVTLILVCAEGLEITITHPIQMTAPRLNESEMVAVYVVTTMFQSRFAGPDSQRMKVYIPKNCARLGFCEGVPNYPEELANKMALELGESNLFVDSDGTEPLFTSRLSDIYNGENACKATQRYIVPRLIRTNNGDWNFVLNPIKNPIHVFSAEICNHHYRETYEEQECSKKFSVKDQAKTSCVQSYVYRNLQVMYSDITVQESFKIPCCCLCVAVNGNDNED